MMPELSEQIRELVDGGAGPVTAAEAAGSAGAAAAPRGGRPGRAAVIAAAAAVLACAGGLAATGLGAAGPTTGVAGPARPAVLTAAMVRRVAAASGTALARSGRVLISFRTVSAGSVTEGSDTITFSGQDYNFAGRVSSPAGGGQPASSESFVNRVVDGRAYDYFVASHGLRWYHVTGPDAVSGLHIPDPRILLSVLTPRAGFAAGRWQQVGGLRLRELHATAPGRLGALVALPDVQPGEHVTSLTVWVDRAGVVRRMAIGLRAAIRVWKFRVSHRHGIARVIMPGAGGARRVSVAQFRRIKARLFRDARAAGDLTSRRAVTTTTMRISFTDIGQPEPITAPPHAITIAGHG